MKPKLLHDIRLTWTRLTGTQEHERFHVLIQAVSDECRHVNLGVYEVKNDPKKLNASVIPMWTITSSDPVHEILEDQIMTIVREHLAPAVGDSVYGRENPAYPKFVKDLDTGHAEFWSDIEVEIPELVYP